ncbi:MAG: aldolase [Acidobacteriaceae bacterium]|jgi:2-dehydro-3-deoxyglucarate aldolase/4-hydroxy-2-oxoheptanedioate aldolase|nr:aldolase [Acidobacteriaceae bacterium]
MKPNRLQQALAARGSAVGTMIMEFGTRGVAKILASTPVDFVMIDMEHTGFDTSHVADLCAWFKATDIAPFVRIPQNLYHFCARTLDAGALGIMVANVENAEQAKAIVDACKYAPMGKRGIALGTAHSDYLVPDPVGYFARANENTTVITMIESPSGLANLDAIAATPGVDVLWVGHYDLSSAMGIPGEFQHPDFLAALAAVVAAAARHGKVAAIQPGNAAQAKQWHEIGFRILSWSVDLAVYRNAVNAGVTELQELLGTA